jgi:hypothetical protein
MVWGERSKQQQCQVIELFMNHTHTKQSELRAVNYYYSTTLQPLTNKLGDNFHHQALVLLRSGNLEQDVHPVGNVEELLLLHTSSVLEHGIHLHEGGQGGVLHVVRGKQVRQQLKQSHNDDVVGTERDLFGEETQAVAGGHEDITEDSGWVRGRQRTLQGGQDVFRKQNQESFFLGVELISEGLVSRSTHSPSSYKVVN